MIELPRHPDFNTLDKPGRSASWGRTRLLNVLTDYELWDEIIDLSRTTYLEPTEVRRDKGERFRTLGLAHLHKGNRVEASQQVANIRALLKEQKEERFADAEKAEAKARKEKQNEEKISQAMAEAMQKHSDPIRSLQAGLAELQGYEALADGDYESALQLIESARDISKIRKAQFYLGAGDPKKAAELGREALQEGTNQVHVLAKYVRLLDQCGKSEEAKNAFEQLRSAAGHADLDTPLLEKLRGLAKKLDYPEDWRWKLSPSSDVGRRPALASLGPFRWEPSPAPDWGLPDSFGSTLSLRDYRGKPVLLIFYLGSGCLHCMEQLRAFAPVSSRFEKEGISLVGIGSGPVEDVQRAREIAQVSFPLVSDSDLDIFKAYRAYDDFENMPLHGVFLVDGNGKVLWHDISYRPFKDTEFLLGESRRLLQLQALQLTGLRRDQAAFRR
jgi:peroxiredoxin